VIAKIIRQLRWDRQRRRRCRSNIFGLAEIRFGPGPREVRWNRLREQSLTGAVQPDEFEARRQRPRWLEGYSDEAAVRALPWKRKAQAPAEVLWPAKMG
jgi:hypothetical protein